MNRYLVRVMVPIYYEIQVSANSHELAEAEAARRFHDLQREPLDFGELQVLRARLIRTEIHRSSPTHSHQIRPRWYRSSYRIRR